jgi:hypothetical protein
MDSYCRRRCYATRDSWDRELTAWRTTNVSDGFAARTPATGGFFGTTRKRVRASFGFVAIFCAAGAPGSVGDVEDPVYFVVLVVGY